MLSVSCPIYLIYMVQIGILLLTIVFSFLNVLQGREIDKTNYLRLLICGSVCFSANCRGSSRLMSK